MFNIECKTLLRWDIFASNKRGIARTGSIDPLRSVLWIIITQEILVHNVFSVTYMLCFPCSFPQVGRRVSIAHAHIYVHTCLDMCMLCAYRCAIVHVCVCRKLDMGPRSYLEIQFRVIHIGTRV